MDKIIGIREAAKLLGIDPSTLRRWETEGKIKSFRTHGNHRRYNMRELLNEERAKGLTIGYARVSISDQKEDF